VVTPDAEHVAPLVLTLKSELGEDFDIEPVTLDTLPSEDELKRHLARNKPNAVVLVDNSAVQLYTRATSDWNTPPAAVIVMASFVRELQKLVRNSTAIEFEPPAVTTLNDVRNILGRRVRRAGVVYREGFENFIAEERQRAHVEEIELVAFSVPSEPSIANIARALHRIESEKVDAVWITNDNALLTRRFIASAWVPFAKNARLPVVVGVPALVQSSVPLGTYAAVPDTVGLGVQTADIILAIAASDWAASRVPVQPAVSVKTYVNVELARSLGAPQDFEKRVDVLFSGEP
jgi:putative ABC transport system substrate-binding protein